MYRDVDTSRVVIGMGKQSRVLAVTYGCLIVELPYDLPDRGQDNYKKGIVHFSTYYTNDKQSFENTTNSFRLCKAVLAAEV